MASIAEPVIHHLAWASIRAVCRLAVRRVELRVEGLEHFPMTGPVVIAARHFHHFYDGCALLAVVPRRLHVVVTLDWLSGPLRRGLMAWVCRLAGWPVVPRFDDQGYLGDRTTGTPSGLAISQLRSATRECVRLLRAGLSLLVFPEGYPNIDPSYTPKTDDDAFLPFRPGFIRFVALAERDGLNRVPIIPVGLEYRRGDRWLLTIRFGQPITSAPGVDDEERVLAIEEQVRRLSGSPEAPRGSSTAATPVPGLRRHEESRRFVAHT